VSYDEFDTADSSTSHVDVYNVANISSPMVVASLTLTNAVCGMAVQPGTMDIYVATFTDDVVDGMLSTTNPGGIFCFTNASGYSQASKLLEQLLSVLNNFVDARFYGFLYEALNAKRALVGRESRQARRRHKGE
jgi:hypothetical protein